MRLEPRPGLESEAKGAKGGQARSRSLGSRWYNHASEQSRKRVVLGRQEGVMGESDWTGYSSGHMQRRWEVKSAKW